MITRVDNTIENLKSLWIELFLDKTNKVSNVADGSVLNATAYGTAKVAQKAIKDIAITEAKLFPDTAVGMYLDECASLYGVSPRKGALGSSTYVRVYANPNTVYTTDMVFVNKNGIRFSVDKETTVGISGYAYVPVRSINAGFATNVAPNSIVVVSPQPTGHIECTNEYYAIGGRDSEDDETFRIRIKNNNNQCAQGTLEYWTQVLQEIDSRVLKVLNVGLGENGFYELYIVSQNGIYFTEDELDNLLEQAKSKFGLFETNLEGDVIGIVFKNAEWFFIGSERGMDFRVEISPEYNVADVRRNIQVSLTKYLDFRFWEANGIVQWDDLLDVVKKTEGVKFVPDEYFFPSYDESVPVNQLPRIRGFVMRDIEGNILYDAGSDLSPLFYPAEAEDIFRGLSDSSLSLNQPAYFIVTDEEGKPVEGARVTVGANSVITDTNGQATISLINGNYDYQITKTKYSPSKGSFVILNNSVIISATLQLAPFEITFNIIGEDNNPVTGAQIDINNTSIVTDNLGRASLNVKAGTYPYTITKLGYEQITGKAVQVTDQDISIVETMYLFAFAITINVQDELSRPLNGVIVNIGANSYLTDEDGQISTNLVNGDYVVKLSKVGYNEQNIPITIKNSDESFTYQMSLFAYTTTITVFGEDGITPVRGANISINEGNQTGITDENGKASFKTVNGNYSYTVTQRAFDDYKSNFTIMNGDLNLSVTMTLKHFNVIITAVDDNLNPIGSATVNIANQVLTTNAQGQVTISLQDGTYPYTITKLGYYDFSGSVRVQGSDISSIANMTGRLYNVLFTIKDGEAPVDGAAISVFGRSLITNSQGQATTQLINGVYSYQVSKQGFEDYSSSLTVANQDENVNIALEAKKFAVTFQISDRGSYVVGAEITIGEETITTNEAGIAVFNLKNGSYNYLITKTGYVNEQGSIAVDNVDLNQDITITPLSYDVVFRVVEQGTDPAIPVGNAEIRIDNQTFNTDATGEVTISIYAGSYPVTYTKTGYQELSTSVTIEGEQTIEQAIKKFYTLQFSVVAATKEAIEGATVNVSGDAIVEGPLELTTNANGLTNEVVVVNGSYSYSALKTGYSPETGTGTVANTNSIKEVALVYGIQTTFHVEGPSLPLANGVYIQDTDHKLYTKTEWEGLATKPTPNGIAVISTEASFVIGLGESPERIAWQTTAGDIAGLPNFDTADLAKLDFGGKSNSDIIQAASNGGANAPANAYCQSYTFPDGSKGYLPACGELYTAYQNITAINELLTLVGGTSLHLYIHYWSSSLTSSETSTKSAWMMNFSASIMSGAKTNTYNVRAFTSLPSQGEATGPIEGATVVVDGIETKTTNASGDAVYLLSTGSHSYKITKASYLSVEGTVEVASEIQTINVDLVTGALVSFSVKEGEVGVAGATITINTTSNGVSALSTITGTTDSDGNYKTELASGNYFFIISKDGYADTILKDFTVGIKPLIIEQDITNYHYWSAEFSNVIEGSVVTIQNKAGGDAKSQTVTSTGSVTFLNVLNGTYTLSITKTGYQPINTEFTVAGENYSYVADQVQISNVKFTCTLIGSGPLADVAIRLYNDSVDLNGTTLADGAYTFTQIENGTYNYTATPAGGLAVKTGQVEVTGEDVNVSLSFENNIDLSYTVVGEGRKANGVFIQTKDGSLYTKAEWEALPNKPLKSGVYIQTVDGKVYTEEQYKALVPNGVYIQTVDGKLYTKAEWEAYKPADGVYIESVDGDLYTKDQWNALANKPEANGVCVVSGGHIFTIAPTESPNTLTWGDQVLINNITTTTDASVAKADFNGNSNANFIISQLGSDKVPAAEYCQNYTFLNGSKGYLPAVGELWTAYNNKTEVDACMSLIGGTAISTNYYHWSSTQASNTGAWILNWSNGYVNGNGKASSHRVRAFAVAKKYTPKGIAVVTDETRYVMVLSKPFDTFKWQTTAGDIAGLPNFDTADLAKLDFGGKSNSDIIQAASNGGANAPANAYCQSYTFPDGSKGYLPACGELYTAYQNITAINELLTLVGETIISDDIYWSSSEYSADYAWGMYFYGGYSDDYSKTTSYIARPFTPLSFEDITLKLDSIVVVDSRDSFKIALEESNSILAWQTTPSDLARVTTTTDKEVAKVDYGGWYNSNAIYNQDKTAPATLYCTNYVFPNGDIGYLPACGQWQIAYDHKTEVDACVSLIGGTVINTGYYHWTSTQYSGTHAWVLRWSDGNVDGSPKTNSLRVRAFTDFENGDPNLTPNGIVVIDDNCAFVMALEDTLNTLAWQTTASDITNLTKFSSADLAKLDFSGKSSSDYIAAASNGGANAPANNYCQSFTFSDGSKGYLPALGEWQVAYNNKAEVDSCISLIGGTAISPSHYYWASTQYSATDSWRLYWLDGSVSNQTKTSPLKVRAFGVYNPIITQPLEGAKIDIKNSTGGGTQSKNTNSNGEALFQVTKNDSYHYDITLNRFVPYSANTAVLTENTHLSIQLTKAVAFTLTVKENSLNSSTGVASATITLTKSGSSAIVGTTDSSGVAILYIEKDAQYNMTVEKTGYKNYTTTVTVSGDDSLSVALLKLYTVTVNCQRVGVVEQGVSLSYYENEEVVKTGTSDASGNWVMENMAYYLGGRIAWNGSSKYKSGNLETDISSNNTIYVTLVPLYSLTFETNQEGATVSITGVATGTKTTGTDGSVTFDNVPVGAVAYTVSKTGMETVTGNYQVEQTTAVTYSIPITLTKQPKLVLVTTNQNPLNFETGFTYVSILVVGSGGAGSVSQPSNSLTGPGGGSGGVAYIPNILISELPSVKITFNPGDTVLTNIDNTSIAICNRGSAGTVDGASAGGGAGGIAAVYRSGAIAVGGNGGGGGAYTSGSDRSGSGAGSNGNGNSENVSTSGGLGGDGTFAHTGGTGDSAGGAAGTPSNSTIIPLTTIFNGTGKGGSISGVRGSGGGGGGGYGGGGDASAYTPTAAGLGAGGGGDGISSTATTTLAGGTSVVAIYYHDNPI